MEGKTLILSLVIMSLVMAQVQVEAFRSCCPTFAARELFHKCTYDDGYNFAVCASRTGCQLVQWGLCPPGYEQDMLENSVNHDVNEYCKLGCISSMCGAMPTLKNSDASGIVNGAVEKCVKACSTLCSKGSMTAFYIK